MCSQYWTVKFEYQCHFCGSRQSGGLQTHFMGDFGSCANYYDVGERVQELRGIEAATLGEGFEDDFISVCANCRGVTDWGARIEDEAVVELWPYRRRPAAVTPA